MRKRLAMAVVIAVGVAIIAVCCFVSSTVVVVPWLCQADRYDVPVCVGDPPRPGDKR